METFARLGSKFSRCLKMWLPQQTLKGLSPASTVFLGRSRSQARRANHSLRCPRPCQSSRGLVVEANITKGHRRLHGEGEAKKGKQGHGKNFGPVQAVNDGLRRLATFSSSRAAHGVPARLPYNTVCYPSTAAAADVGDQGKPPLGRKSFRMVSRKDSTDRHTSPTNVSFNKGPPANDGAAMKLQKSHGSRTTIDVTFCDKQRHSTETPNPSELRVVFDWVDENKDGSICASDLRGFLNRTTGFEMSQEEAEILLRLSSADGSAVLDLDNFLSLYESLCDEVDRVDNKLTNAAAARSK